MGIAKRVRHSCSLLMPPWEQRKNKCIPKQRKEVLEGWREFATRASLGWEKTCPESDLQGTHYFQLNIFLSVRKKSSQFINKTVEEEISPLDPIPKPHPPPLMRCEKYPGLYNWEKGTSRLWLLFPAWRHLNLHLELLFVVVLDNIFYQVLSNPSGLRFLFMGNESIVIIT